ncbi:MAG: hypothetical protein AB8B95_13785 [Pseudohongiellaceae bacterium]
MESVVTSKSLTLGFAAAMALNVICFSPNLSAQSQQSMQTELNSANSRLAELDEKAFNCLGSFNINLGEAAALLCDEFIRAVDGETLADYISHCRTLKTWKNQITEDSNASKSELETKLLADIELRCAENAVKEQTRYVFAAFTMLQQRTLLNQTTGQTLERRLNEIEFQSRLDTQGRRLREAVRNQGQQSIESTQQQMQSLERELIRQQQEAPPR